MPNGRSGLDKEGCEFGRHIQDRVKKMEEDMQEIGDTLKDIRVQLNRRLPIWASAGFAGAGVIIGIMGGLIAS